MWVLGIKTRPSAGTKVCSTLPSCLSSPIVFSFLRQSHATPGWSWMRVHLVSPFSLLSRLNLRDAPSLWRGNWRGDSIWYLNLYHFVEKMGRNTKEWDKFSELKESGCWRVFYLGEPGLKIRLGCLLSPGPTGWVDVGRKPSMWMRLCPIRPGNKTLSALPL